MCLRHEICGGVSTGRQWLTKSFVLSIKLITMTLLLPQRLSLERQVARTSTYVASLEPIREVLEFDELDVIFVGRLILWRAPDVEARTAPCRGPQWLTLPSDLTDNEWAIVEPMIPHARHSGRKRSVNVRQVLNAIFYMLWTGCQWKALPKDLPPKSTVHDYLELWNWDGTLERICHALYMGARAGGT